jgi:hypothetical protein
MSYYIRCTNQVFNNFNAPINYVFYLKHIAKRRVLNRHVLSFLHSPSPLRHSRRHNLNHSLYIPLDKICIAIISPNRFIMKICCTIDLIIINIHNNNKYQYIFCICLIKLETGWLLEKWGLHFFGTNEFLFFFLVGQKVFNYSITSGLSIKSFMIFRKKLEMFF